MQAGSYASYPELRRARGYRLYTRSGTRLLDLYQDDGRAFLGHDPNGVSRAMKAEIDRGLYAAGPSPYMRRLQRELSTLWQSLAARPETGVAQFLTQPGRDWVVFASHEQFREATSKHVCVLWRPGLPLNTFQAPSPDPIVELRLPLPGACTPIVAGFPPGALASAAAAANAAANAAVSAAVESAPKATSLHYHCSPVQLAGLHRVVTLLRSDPRTLGGRVSYGTLEDDWRGLSTPLFVRHGAYLQPQVPDSRYQEVHQAMMERGIFLNPSAHGLSIIPGECSAGEFAMFSQACEDLKEFADVS